MKSLTVLTTAAALALAFSPAIAKEYLWQTNAYGDDVHIIDTETQKVVGHIVVGPQPHGIAAPDNAGVIYIAIENFKGAVGELIWVDPVTRTVTHRLDVGPKPNQIACTPDGRWVYVPCNDGNYWVVDAEERKVVKKIHTGGRPHNTQSTRDGRFMYLSPMGKGEGGKTVVTIVDVESGHEVVGEIPFADSPRPPALSADNKRFYQHIDKLVGFQVADIASRKVIATVEHEIPAEMKDVKTRCHGLAIRPDQEEIWSCNVEHKIVHVHALNREGYPEIARIPMIGRVYWLCFSPDSKRCYVAVRSDRKVCVVDTESKKVIGHIEVGDTPKRNLVVVLPE